MKRMKNLISIVFLTVWMLNVVQAIAGVCGSGHCCCCSKNEVSVRTSVEALVGFCGQKDCAIVVNKEMKTPDTVLPSFKMSSLSQEAISVDYFGVSQDAFLSSFRLFLLHLRPPLSEAGLYIRYHQFLI